MYLTFLAFVTIREKRNEWVQEILIQGNNQLLVVALKSLFFFLFFLFLSVGKKKEKLHSWASNELVLAPAETLASRATSRRAASLLLTSWFTGSGERPQPAACEVAARQEQHWRSSSRGGPPCRLSPILGFAVHRDDSIVYCALCLK